jgi:hypothetical protein
MYYEMKSYKSHKLFFRFLLFLVIVLTSSSFSQVVLDSVVITGEKHKTLKEQIREKTRVDISNGKVILFAHGWPVGGKIDEQELLKLTHKYGFEYENRGDVISSIDVIYEDEVRCFLDKRNGEGWWDRFQEEEMELITPITWPKEK